MSFSVIIIKILRASSRDPFHKRHARRELQACALGKRAKPSIEMYKVKELQLALKVEDDVKSLKRKDPDVQGMSMSRSRLNVVKCSAANGEATLLAQNMVRDYLTPVECTAFHEVVCFTNADILQSALIGDPRRTIQVDLLQSHTYLHCSCCCKGGNGLLPSMHDT